MYRIANASFSNKDRNGLVIAMVALLLVAATPSCAFAPLTATTNQRRKASLFQQRPDIAAFPQHHTYSNPMARTPHYIHNSRGSAPSSLQMFAGSTMAIGAIAGSVTGGLFSGGLHAIAGPDHLAALLPRCCGQRWYKAGRIGALWGMGHGTSAIILGMLAFGLKNRMSTMGGAVHVLQGASDVMEIAVGLSLVVIGLLGIKEAREWKEENDTLFPPSITSDDGVHVAAELHNLKSTATKRAVVFNGLLHGFSWDGAPSLAPAIAVATWRGNLAFLFSYALGTMAAMTITTTLIGEGTRRASEVFRRPDIPQKLSFFSSILALIIGTVWCSIAVFR